MSVVRERQEKAKASKLAEMQQQIASGKLIIRQQTPEEKAAYEELREKKGYPPRKPRNKR